MVWQQMLGPFSKTLHIWGWGYLEKEAVLDLIRILFAY